MNTFWLTLIEINLILSLVYLGYIVLLKNLTFFKWTRIYLLAGMAIGLIYPFLKTQQVVYTPKESVNIVIPDLTKLSQQQSFDYNQWAIYALCAIGVLLLLRFLIRFLSLGKIHFASRKAEFNGLEFRNTQRQVNPFSFWKWIYIHSDSHSNTEMNQIVTHEHIHTRQRHTFDVLVAELCTIICWYNPFIKLLAKAVKDNLEFLVDAEMLHSGIDKISYQHSLVGVSINHSFQSPYGNNFAFKSLKQRIKMMNKTRSSKLRLSAFVVLAPVLLITASFLTFSCQKETLDTLKAAEKGETISLNQANTNLEQKTDLFTNNPEKKIEFERSVTAIVDTVTGKSEITNVTLNVFEADNNFLSFEASKLEFDKNGLLLNEPVILKKNKNNLANPLYIVDGIQVSDIKSLNANNIESINILKNESATALYGDKGKNGVILVTTRQGSRQ